MDAFLEHQLSSALSSPRTPPSSVAEAAAAGAAAPIIPLVVDTADATGVLSASSTVPIIPLAKYPELVYRAENNEHLYELKNRLPVQPLSWKTQACAASLSKPVKQGVQLEAHKSLPNSNIYSPVSYARAQLKETTEIVSSPINSAVLTIISLTPPMNIAALL